MSKNIISEFPYIGSDLLEKDLDARKGHRTKLKLLLPSPLYWFQFPGGRKIFWNYRLIRDYLLNGGDTPEHQQLVEQYLASIEPPTQNQTPKAARTVEGA